MVPTTTNSAAIEKSNKHNISKANCTYSVAEYVTMLSKFVPSLVIQRLIEKKKNNETTWKLPELQESETVVIFADISGFTNLSEACARKG